MASEESGSSGSSSSEDERRDKKKEKKAKKEKRHKKEKKRKREKEKDHKSKKKAKSHHDKKGHGDDPQDATSRKRPIPCELSSEDYYNRATEFRVWLRTEKKTNFEDLKREDAQELFDSFVQRWNKGKLPDMYYDGIPDHIQQACLKTTHKWGFVKAMNEQDQFALETATDTVTSQTKKNPFGGSGVPKAPTSSAGGAKGGGSARDQLAKEVEAEERKAERNKDKKYRRDQERVMLEDIAPKATGRDAKIEKRKDKADKIHGAARAAEESRDGLDMNEGQLMGDNDDIQARLRRIREAQSRRSEQATRRVNEYQEAEKARMAAFMEQMGLKPGQKITIPKRSDVT